VLAVERREVLPDGAPHSLLGVGVLDLGHRITLAPAERLLRDVVPPGSVIRIAKAGVVLVELDDVLGARGGSGLGGASEGETRIHRPDNVSPPAADC
jgi:hypothetical protein